MSHKTVYSTIITVKIFHSNDKIESDNNQKCQLGNLANFEVFISNEWAEKSTPFCMKVTSKTMKVDYFIIVNSLLHNLV